MRIYELYDEDLQRKTPIGVLLYYQRRNAFILELADDLDEWTAPLLFGSTVKKRIYTISREHTLLWVRERIVPPTRQNIGAILKNAGMKEYNEAKLLALTGGRCPQDACYLKEITEEELPAWVSARQKENINEAFFSEDGNLIITQKNDEVRKVPISTLVSKRPRIKAFMNAGKKLTVTVGPGGYDIAICDDEIIEKSELVEVGRLLDVEASDFRAFVRQRLVGVSSACGLLGCSRQNLSYLVKEKGLEPAKIGLKENLYYKGSIEQL